MLIALLFPDVIFKISIKPEEALKELLMQQ